MMGFLDLIFGGSSYKARARRDQKRFTVMGKNFISPINTYGTCFCCNGNGSKKLDCRPCNGNGTFSGTCRLCSGNGTFTLPAKECLTCDGSGVKNGSTCRKCNGSGEFKPEITLNCKKCHGSGRFSSSCKKCEGRGSFSVSCKKCSGSGWHRF